MSIKEDLVPQKYMKKMKPGQNGRLEVWWRIYDALCNIETGDWTEEQRNILAVQRKTAYEQYVVEGNLMYKDGLQGKLGFAAAKKQHLKDLKDKTSLKK